VVFLTPEDDEAALPLKDRMRLAQAGVDDLPNVYVLPSWSFIIALTGQRAGSSIGLSLDASVFCDYVAPALDITQRFIGEGADTKEYVRTLARVLPRSGIKVISIPRQTTGPGAVTTAEVRAVLQTGDFDSISQLVPPETMVYLMDRFLAQSVQTSGGPSRSGLVANSLL
jgi:[citrate (pro-3S)-lyase] ligase